MKKKVNQKPKPKAKPMNPWMKHLNDVRKKNPKMTLSECMLKAKKTYKK